MRSGIWERVRDTRREGEEKEIAGEEVWEEAEEVQIERVNLEEGPPLCEVAEVAERGCILSGRQRFSQHVSHSAWHCCSMIL